MKRTPTFKSDKERLVKILRHQTILANYLQRAGTTDVNRIAKDGLIVDALSQNIQVIGELGHWLTDSTKVALACMDFKNAYELRNQISHSYDTVNPTRIVILAFSFIDDIRVKAVKSRILYCDKHMRT